jgi:hypothetical protein
MQEIQNRNIDIENVDLNGESYLTSGYSIGTIDEIDSEFHKNTKKILQSISNEDKEAKEKLILICQLLQRMKKYGNLTDGSSKLKEIENELLNIKLTQEEEIELSTLKIKLRNENLSLNNKTLGVTLLDKIYRSSSFNNTRGFLIQICDLIYCLFKDVTGIDIKEYESIFSRTIKEIYIDIDNVSNLNVENNDELIFSKLLHTLKNMKKGENLSDNELRKLIYMVYVARSIQYYVTSSKINTHSEIQNLELMSQIFESERRRDTNSMENDSENFMNTLEILQNFRNSDFSKNERPSPYLDIENSVHECRLILQVINHLCIELKNSQWGLKENSSKFYTETFEKIQNEIKSKMPEFYKPFDNDGELKINMDNYMKELSNDMKKDIKDSSKPISSLPQNEIGFDSKQFMNNYNIVHKYLKLCSVNQIELTSEASMELLILFFHIHDNLKKTIKENLKNNTDGKKFRKWWSNEVEQIENQHYYNLYKMVPNFSKKIISTIIDEKEETDSNDNVDNLFQILIEKMKNHGNNNNSNDESLVDDHICEFPFFFAFNNFLLNLIHNKDSINKMKDNESIILPKLINFYDVNFKKKTTFENSHENIKLESLSDDYLIFQFVKNEFESYIELFHPSIESMSKNDSEKLKSKINQYIDFLYFNGVDSLNSLKDNLYSNNKLSIGNKNMNNTGLNKNSKDEMVIGKATKQQYSSNKNDSMSMEHDNINNSTILQKSKLIIDNDLLGNQVYVNQIEKIRMLMLNYENWYRSENGYEFNLSDFEKKFEIIFGKIVEGYKNKHLSIIYNKIKSGEGNKHLTEIKYESHIHNLCQHQDKLTLNLKKTNANDINLDDISVYENLEKYYFPYWDVSYSESNYYKCCFDDIYLKFLKMYKINDLDQLRKTTSYLKSLLNNEKVRNTIEKSNIESIFLINLNCSASEFLEYYYCNNPRLYENDISNDIILNNSNSNHTIFYKFRWTPDRIKKIDHLLNATHEEDMVSVINNGQLKFIPIGESDEALKFKPRFENKKKDAFNRILFSYLIEDIIKGVFSIYDMNSAKLLTDGNYRLVNKKERMSSSMKNNEHMKEARLNINKNENSEMLLKFISVIMKYGKKYQQSLEKLPEMKEMTTKYGKVFENGIIRPKTTIPPINIVFAYDFVSSDSKMQDVSVTSDPIHLMLLKLLNWNEKVYLCEKLMLTNPHISIVQ